ncbi:MAG: hypothetical protein ABF306_03395 [Nocardioides marinisabuli]|uniref:hypothetical protein n=1 Tax=Nocardioides marinisabuli TaxID=419476 RepID=UPI00321A2F5D
MAKRLVAVLALSFGLSLVAATGPASAASICIDYDISINGQGQAGSQCLPG